MKYIFNFIHLFILSTGTTNCVTNLDIKDHVRSWEPTVQFIDSSNNLFEFEKNHSKTFKANKKDVNVFSTDIQSFNIKITNAYNCKPQTAEMFPPTSIALYQSFMNNTPISMAFVERYQGDTIFGHIINDKDFATAISIFERLTDNSSAPVSNVSPETKETIKKSTSNTRISKKSFFVVAGIATLGFLGLKLSQLSKIDKK